MTGLFRRTRKPDWIICLLSSGVPSSGRARIYIYMRTRDSGKRAIPRFPRNFNDNGPVGTPVGCTDESIEENGPNLRGASLRKRALDSVVPLENVRPVSRPLPSPPPSLPPIVGDILSCTREQLGCSTITRATIRPAERNSATRGIAARCNVISRAGVPRDSSPRRATANYYVREFISCFLVKLFQVHSRMRESRVLVRQSSFFEF